MSIHMHEHGKDMKYMLMFPDGKVQTILSQPRYDFNWQMTYDLEETIHIPKGTKLRVMSHFDNSRGNKFAHRCCYGPAQRSQLQASQRGYNVDH